MLGYFAKFPFVICQLHFVKLLSSHCHHLVLLFFLVKFIFSLCQLNYTKLHESALPKLAFLICQLHFAKLQSWHCPILNQTSPCLNSQLCFAILPDFQVLFFYFAKLPSPVQPVDCPNKLQAVHKLIVFGDVQGLNFFLVCSNVCLRKFDCPCFFVIFFPTGCLGNLSF